MSTPQLSVREMQLKKLDEVSQEAGGTDKKVDKPGDDEPQYVFSLQEIWKGRHEKTKFLIDDLIPANTVTLVIGEDGIGKTQLFTQLCLSVCYGEEKFLNLPLNTDRKTALIIATEDSKQKFASAVSKQLLYFDPYLKDDSPMVDLDFMEAADLEDWKHFQKVVKKRLQVKKYGLILIDAFSDVFTYMDGNINDNGDARTLLSKFQTWAKTHECPVIVIHHAAKTKVVAIQAAGKLLIEKNSSQGAGSITQKPRTILGLTHDKSTEKDGVSTNYLHVLKANIMSKKYIHEILELEFHELNLIHQFVRIASENEIDKTDGPAGGAPPYEKTDSGQTRLIHPRNLDMNHHFILTAAIFETQKVYALKTEIIPHIAANYKISDRAAEKEYWPYLLEIQLIKKAETGGYVFGGNSNIIVVPEVPAPTDPNDDDDLPF